MSASGPLLPILSAVAAAPGNMSAGPWSMTQDDVDPKKISGPNHPRAAYFTLGCKVNQYETEYVRELLEAHGYQDAAEGAPVDVAVVNTCTVTAESDRKSRKLVRQLARRHPGIQVIVMGCYATRDAEAVKQLPGVTHVITSKMDLASSLREFGVRRSVRGIKRFQGRSRAFVKVQDGCMLNCAFCIIPSVRPDFVSRPIVEIASEIRGLVEVGYREIVLAGIHLGHYGLEWSKGKPRQEWRRLAHLLEALAKIEGSFRLRLSSIESTEVTTDVIRVMADHQERLCPHLHLSMQSGSDRILAAMKRRYRIKRFLECCDRLRDRLDEPAFSTDIIIGFPGETEADFDQTVRAAKLAGFSKMHLFPFSPRAGTVAAGWADDVSPQVKQDRLQRLAAVGRGLATQYFSRLLGRRLEMLVEQDEGEGGVRGTACRYAPLKLVQSTAPLGALIPVVGRRLVEEGIEVVPREDHPIVAN